VHQLAGQVLEGLDRRPKKQEVISDELPKTVPAFRLALSELATYRHRPLMWLQSRFVRPNFTLMPPDILTGDCAYCSIMARDNATFRISPFRVTPGGW